MTQDPEILVRGMKEAALAAGKHIGQNIAAHTIYDEKSLNKPDAVSNPVTRLDKEAETIIVNYLRNNTQLGNRLHFIGEEHTYEKAGDINVYIDPIDGTKSFVRGEFLSTTSIGAHLGDAHLGVVYDFMRGIMYATDIHGDKLVPTATFLNHGGVVSDMPVREKVALNKYKIPTDDAPRYEALFGTKPDYDVIGSIALLLAQVAYGALDGIVMKSKKTNYYDVAGGLALLKASGAKLYDFDNKPVTETSWNNGIITMRPYVKLAQN